MGNKKSATIPTSSKDSGSRSQGRNLGTQTAGLWSLPPILAPRPSERRPGQPKKA